MTLVLSAGLNSGVGGNDTSADDEDFEEVATRAQWSFSLSMGVSTGVDRAVEAGWY